MIRKIAMAVVGFLLAASVAFGQAAYTSPETGIKPLGSYASWGIDRVSLTNGNLMLNIPLFSLPGRELPVSLGVSYNSQFMEQRTVPGELGQLVTVWESQAWRKNTGIGGTLSGTSRTTPDGELVEVYWIGPDGSKTRFSETFSVVPGTASNTYLDNRTIDATDSSFLRLETGHYFNDDDLGESTTRKPAILYYPNGTTLTFERDPGSAITQPQRWTLETANGDAVSVGDETGTVVGNDVNLYDVLPTTDTLNRTITFTSNENTQTIELPSGTGESRTYRINWSSVMYRGPYLESVPSSATASSVDMVQSIDLPNGQSYDFSYDTDGRIQTLTLPTGGRIVYGYFQPGGSTHWFVHSRTVYPDGDTSGTSGESWTFGYAPGRPVGTPDAEGGPTPATATVRDPTGAAMRHYFTDNLETKVETTTAVDPTTASIKILQTVEQIWENTRDNPRVKTVKVTLPNGKVRKVDYTYHSFTDSNNNTVTYNNVIGEAYFDFGDGTNWTSLGTVSREFSTSQTHLDKRLLRLATSETRDGDRTTYTYDDTGNPTGMTRFATATATLTTSHIYDSLKPGNLIRSTDPGGHATAIVYTDRFSDQMNRSSKAYPTKVTDHSGYWVETTYDYNTGLPTKTVDSAGRTTATTYDKMNRPLKITQPDGGYVQYDYDDTARTITKEVLVDALGNVGKQVTRLDKLGRVTQTETSDPEGNILVDTKYDKKGRVSEVSNPYRSGGTAVWNRTEYDAMDRPTTRTGPDGSTVTYDYTDDEDNATTDNQTTVTDQAGNSRRYTYDGLGRMVKVEEPNQTLTTPQVTTYEYTFHGDLKQTSQGGQVRTFAYDGVRRKTRQTLPESGTMTYAYNSDGLLSSMTDARSVTTTYTYDAGHRLTGRSYSDSTPAVSFTYDTKGTRTQMTDGLGTVDYTYDTMDRLTREQRALTGLTGTFTTGYDYDRKGNLTQVTYPSGRVVDYNYATGGGCCNSRLDSVVDKTTDTNVVHTRTYQAFGGMLTQTLGNGATQSFSYNSRLQLTGITAAAGGHTVMDFSYGYVSIDENGVTTDENTGRVRSRTDAVQPEHSVTYDYDSIYRLEQVQGPDDSWGIAWEFDTWGNRLTQTPTGLAVGKVGTQTLGYTGTTNRNTAFMYDAAGNQKTDGTHNYTFNAENQITQMDAGAALYVYDGDGRRMKKTVGTETTYYFYAMGMLVSEFSTTNTGATGAASTDRTTYQTSDKLGSAVLLMAAAGLVIENNRTLPYGEEWQPAVGSDNEQKFTSYQRDGESGLDYALNRYASNRNGRFQSVDRGPYLLRIPASLNRYVMTLADPVNYTDPDGRIVSVEGPSWNPATWFAERWVETIRSEILGGIYFEELETSTGPLPQTVRPEQMQTRLNSAVSLARMLLQEPSCAGSFNVSGAGLDPVQVLRNLHSGGNYGKFVFGYIGSSVGGRSGTTVYVNAQTTPTNPQRQIVNGVLTFSGFASVEILINSHQNSPFNRGNTYDRAVTVLHELGHAFDIIMGAGRSQLATNDPGPLSAANTALVRRNCP